MKKNGFTLAEVLVTLGIIGVISALTLPSLSNNRNTKTLEVQISKFYNTLVSAVDNYFAQNEVDALDDADFTPDGFITTYMRANECAAVTSCFAATYKTIDGATTVNAANFLNGNGRHSYKLDDGTSISVIQDGTNMHVYVDTNGDKTPNKIGMDFWSITVANDGSVVDGPNVVQIGR